MLPEGDYEENEVYSPFTLSSSYYKLIEPAGEAFERLIEKRLNPNKDDEFLNNEDDPDLPIEEDVEYEWEKEYRLSSKKNSLGFKTGKDENYYSLLGLEKDFINSTQEDIRKAYKKVALLYHPDKRETNTEEEKVEANKTWLKYKDAYETLTDLEKKQKYDSTFKFDDTIPSNDLVLKDDLDFFRKFGPVFLKNSIWSEKKPVPKLGDMSTDLKKVRRFYNFWFSFNTWRDFEVEGEHNVEEAENRWEKRAMLKENKKLKAEKLKDEKLRIRKLVDLAFKNDPRIIAEEKRIVDERERLKKEREAERVRLKKEKEEREVKMQVEYEERKKREAEEKIVKRKEMLNELLTVISKEIGFELSKDQVFNIELNANLENLEVTLTEIKAKETVEDKQKALKQMGNKYFGLKYEDESKDSSSIWTKEEVGNLQKAVKKFPAGTVNRYEKIMESVKTKGLNQVISMTRYISTNPSLKFNGDTVDLKVLLYGDKKEEKKEEKKEGNEGKEGKETSQLTDEKDVWTEEQQKQLEEALKKYPSSLVANERWTKIASEVSGKTKKQCVERFKYLASMLKNKK